MKILLQEDKDTRIVYKWWWRALGRVVCRQRKRWIFWITTTWLYTNQCKTLERYRWFFDWEETEGNLGGRQKIKTQQP